MSTTFNPMSVLMRQRIQQPGTPNSGDAYLQPTTVRATGSGPFDPAYRQNLATYAMGQYQPQSPTGTSFNPTGPIPFGQATGGGNAPVLGTPQTLLGQALGGNPFTTPSPSTPPVSSANNASGGQFGDINSWLQQYLKGYQLPGIAGGIRGF